MGRPRGAWADKPWRDAVRQAVNELDESGEKKLRLLARQLVKEGIAGEVSALREIGDRLDGKPAQDISLDANINHEIAGLSDRELATRIKRELASLAGRGGKAADTGQLH